MEQKNWPKFPVLFSLYIAQSVPMSFFSTVVPVIMRQEQYSLESIGLLQLVKLPWIVKFFWAPMVDNHARSGAQLRRWIVMSELFYALVILTIGFFSLQTDFRLIVLLMVIAFVASATQDIATDIFAIKILQPAERSLGNSMQSAGSFVGSLFGTGVLLVVYSYFGWHWLLWLLAGFVCFALIPLMLYRRPLDTQSTAPVKQVKVSDLFRFFADKSCRRHSLLLVFFYSGLIGILAMLKPFLVDHGYNVKQIGFMSGIVGTSTAAICALVGGLLVKNLGRRYSFYLFAVINIGVTLFFIALPETSIPLFTVYSAICLLWGAYGLSTVIVYTSSMDKVRPGSEGSDFTIQIAITHLSSLIIAVLSGKIGDALGYKGLFVSESVLALAALLLVVYNYPLKRHRDAIDQ